MFRHLSLRVPTFKHLDYAAHNLKYLNATKCDWLSLAIATIGHTPSGRSVRLYTDGCVVDSGTGLMGPCNGFPKSGPNGVSGVVQKSLRFYSLSRSHREYIDSQSRYEIHCRNIGKG